MQTPGERAERGARSASERRGERPAVEFSNLPVLRLEFGDLLLVVIFYWLTGLGGGRRLGRGMTQHSLWDAASVRAVENRSKTNGSGPVSLSIIKIGSSNGRTYRLTRSFD